MNLDARKTFGGIFSNNLKNDGEKIAKGLLSPLGMKINGNNDYDPQILNNHFYSYVFAGGSLALGESYMNKWWECKALDKFITKILQAKIKDKLMYNPKFLLKSLKAKISSVILNHQSRRKAFEIGNDLYQAMLDKRMVYTCGYWKDAENLDQAQEAKLDLVCRKLRLKKGDKVLDIGCGWGSFVIYAAEKYGVEVVGITVSREQAELAKKLIEEKGLSDKITILLQDYRDIDGKFDHIVSLGMFEHVGYKNYRTYMKVVDRCLKDDGLFLLHTIAGNRSVSKTDPWINKYIFPNSMLPSLAQIGKAVEKLFVIEDLHNFGADYDKTLMAWHKNFEENWGRLKDKYDERFRRMWNYYLLSCAGTFRSRYNQLVQIVLSKGMSGIYKPVR